MQILSTLTEQLRVRTLEALSLASVKFVSSWAEYSGPTIENPELILGSLQGGFDNSAFVVLVNTPTSGNQRQVKFISIFNNDDIPHICDFCINTSGTQTQFQVTLQVKDTLLYSDTRGWYVLDLNGNTKTVIQHDPLLQVYTRTNLSGSTNGRPIAVAATATPGTLIHTSVTGTTSLDEIWLWANNRTGTAATLTIEFGGVANSDHTVEALSLPANSGPMLIVPGLVLQNALIVRAFSGTANAINMSGYVNRITVA